MAMEKNKYEVRWVRHVRSNYKNRTPDLHFIKLAIHEEDGTITPKLIVKEDVKKPIYTVKNEYRNYTQCKEYIERYKLDEHKTTESNLNKKVKEVLGIKSRDWLSIRELGMNPYIFGADRPASNMIHEYYSRNWTKASTPYSVTHLDIETSVISDEGEILAVSLVSHENDVVHVYINKSFVSGISDLENKLKETEERELGRHLKTLGDTDKDISELIGGKQITYHVMESEAMLIMDVFETIHTWSPDFLTSWNINFDYPYIQKRCEHLGIDLANLYKDRSLDNKYAVYNYREGADYIITTKGKVRLNVEERWHTVVSAAPFQVVDPMCVYRAKRAQRQKLPSYSADAIFKHELGIGKMEFEETSHLSKLPWHIEMQKNHPLEYVVYNAFDTIGMYLLEEKNRDIGISLPTGLGYSAIEVYPYPGIKVNESMQKSIDSSDFVLGTQPMEPLDRGKYPVLNNDDWILTLVAAYREDNGGVFLEDRPDKNTNIWTHVSDDDFESVYPTITDMCNVSKATNIKEISMLEGVEEHTLRFQNINLVTGGAVGVNAIEYCSEIFDMPVLSELDVIAKNINNRGIRK